MVGDGVVLDVCVDGEGALLGESLVGEGAVFDVGAGEGVLLGEPLVGEGAVLDVTKEVSQQSEKLQVVLEQRTFLKTAVPH